MCVYVCVVTWCVCVCVCVCCHVVCVNIHLPPPLPGMNHTGEVGQGVWQQRHSAHHLARLHRYVVVCVCVWIWAVVRKHKPSAHYHVRWLNKGGLTSMCCVYMTQGCLHCLVLQVCAACTRHRPCAASMCCVYTTQGRLHCLVQIRQHPWLSETFQK